MSRDFVRELGLPREKPPDPEKTQVKMELSRSGVLIWFLHELQEELEGYERNILYSELSDPSVITKLASWQAKRAVVEQWLGRFVDMMDDGGTDGS